MRSLRMLVNRVSAETKQTPGLQGLMLPLDSATKRHCARTQQVAILLCAELGLSSDKVLTVSLGALLHDVGKVLVGENVVSENGPMGSPDWSLMRDHVRLGYELICSRDYGEDVERIVLEHHRWWNGEGGYPEIEGVRQPSELTQIVSIANVYDAMVSGRRHPSGFEPQICLGYLKAHSGTMFKPTVVRALSALVQSGVLVAENDEETEELKSREYLT